MYKVIAAAAAVTMLVPVAALAAPACTTEARDKWMSEDAMKSKVAEMGYKNIRTFKISGNCYEIYGFTKDGRRAEVYFNPVTGSVIKSEIN